MEKTKSERKSYRAPEIRKVALVVEEVVLQACKILNATPRRTGKVSRVCGQAGCSDIGS
jgi:hypothetical protein